MNEVSELKKAFKKIKMDISNLEVPSSESYGDYSLPCFDLARQLKKQPEDVARYIFEHLNLPKSFLKMEVVGNYINLFVNPEVLAERLFKEFKKRGFGRGKVNEKVIVEHTSINPNASPHVGRARNALIGDSLCRVLKFYGYKVETHYFVNDIGKQIAMLVLAAKKSGKKVSFDELLDMYIRINAEMITNASLERKVFELLEKLENGDKETVALFKKISGTAVKGQISILKHLGINYDYFDYESQYIKSKKLGEILKKLGKKVFKDEEGRSVLNLAGYDLPVKSPVLVLTRANGTSLYSLRDLAYTIDKMKLAKKNIIVLGEEQKTYFKQLSAALDILGYKSPELVSYSYVLLSGGEKMSTRQGNIVLLTDFIKEARERCEAEVIKRYPEMEREKLDALAEIISHGAIKYSILRVNPDKNIIFDWNDALNFEGNSAPYLQYTYVRALKLLKNSGNARLKTIVLNEDSEKKLVKLLAKFPEVVKESVYNYKVSNLANYGYDLAGCFNEFYENCNVSKTEDENLKATRIKTVEVYKKVIKRVLSLLGIEVPNYM
ncbi:MAG TPA: arginine--tRNA ligase [Candidatus Woesearchaeota archaeon]|nr:arginine--tRNA ligase [Candidatus Woesearchaeota archaeon]